MAAAAPDDRTDALIVEFRGRVEARLDAAGPLGLWLSGRTADHGGELAQVAFRGPAPEGLPATFYDVRVERAGPSAFRIAGLAQSWLVPAAGVHVHREVAAAFRQAVPQREAPLRKRIFWRIVLSLAASDAGRTLLLALRGRR
jgi:hypothetical protein